MNYQTIEVKPLAGNIGAEILGADLANLTQESFAEIHHAFLEHMALIIRDQDLSVKDQSNFVERFGPLIHDPFIKAPEGSPELLIIEKKENERYTYGDGWHSDSTFMAKPPLASFLYAKEIPPVGGDTLFSNQYLAYETLSPGLKAVLDDLVAVHSASGMRQIIADGKYKDDRTMKLRVDEWDEMEKAIDAQVEDPVVRTHPETGRKALYATRSYLKHFKGWTPEESKPLIDFLFDHSIRPEFTCRIRWEVGSFAMWDNRCALHKPVTDYQGHRRIMYRMMAEGDRPI